MFGDHQPSVEQEFLDKAYGVTRAEMTMEQYMGKYQVPFVVWANYPLPEEGPEGDQSEFPGAVCAALCGIGAAPVEISSGRCRRSCLPVTFVGYVDKEGHAYSHLETNEIPA